MAENTFEKSNEAKSLAETGAGASAGASATGAIAESLTENSVRNGGNFRWVICALLFFATTINYVDRQVLGLLKTTLQGELGWSEIVTIRLPSFCLIR